MTDESYGIMPYSELATLKKQMNELQQKHSGQSADLITSMNNLTKGMDSMLHLFKEAAEEMKSEDQEHKTFESQIKPLMDKLDDIIDQNKIIAEGMVAISELVQKRLPEHKDMPMPQGPPQRPPVSQPRPQGMPNTPPPMGGAPQMPAVPPPAQGDMPSSPPPMMPPDNKFPPPGDLPPMGDMPAPPGDMAPPGMPPEEPPKKGFFRK